MRIKAVDQQYRKEFKKLYNHKLTSKDLDKLSDTMEYKARSIKHLFIKLLTEIKKELAK